MLKLAELTKYVGVVFRQLSTNFAANTLNVVLTLLQGAIYKMAQARLCEHPCNPWKGEMAERVASVPLEAGLFVLRYVQALSSYGAPHVFVRPSPGSEGVVTVLSAPGDRAGSISAPGGCVVVRAERASSLHVTITSTITGGGTEAELRLESLLGDAVRGDETATNFYEAPGSQQQVLNPPPSIALLGHVSRRGDVRVGGGIWVAGPDSPAPVEGLEIAVVGQAAGLGVEYQVQVGGGSWTRWMRGEFAGTRGQARPLLGLRMRLTGGSATQFQIEAEALFLGASVKRVTGQLVEVISNSGVDPMVGLKVALIGPIHENRPIQPQTPSRVKLPAASAANPIPPARPGRVRVFRSAGIR